LVLGIDGFYVDNGELEPIANAIADFSDLKDPEQSVLEAKEFIEAVGAQDVLFDFTLEEAEPLST